MKVILCGYNWIGCKVLDLLLNENYEVYVYTHENPPHINSLIEFCEDRNVEYTTQKISINNIPFKPDVICSIYYRFIIEEKIINLVDGKIFNLHPSLLPEYKGCSSLTWAMIEGKKKVGFTYHYINVGIDTGNIILQKKIKIEDFDTQVTLYHRVMFEAAKDFLNVFNKVLDGYLGKKQQPGGKYFKRGCPYNGNIDRSWDDAKIKRFIRAMNYPPLPYAKINGVEIKTYKEYNSYFNKNEAKN